MPRTPFVPLLLAALAAVGVTLGLWRQASDGTPPFADSSRTASHQPDRPASPTRHVNWMGHWLGNDKREDLVREVKTEFEFLNPGVRVNLKFPQEIMGERSKDRTGVLIADMIKSKKIDWDIVWMDTMIYRKVAAALDDPDWGRKHMVDFSTVPGFLETEKSFIITDSFYRNRLGGILVGPHIEGYYISLFYNKDVAAKMGLQIKKIGMTFDDLLEYARVAQEYNKTHGTHIATFYESMDWFTMGHVFEGLFRSEFPDFDEVNSETFTPRKQAAILKSFRAFEALGRYQPLQPSHRTNHWYNTIDAVLNDEALFYANGTWMYSLWRGADREKLKKMVPAEVPVFQPVDHYLGTFLPAFAVMKDSPNRDDAIRLVMQWGSAKVAEKWVRYTKNPTGVRGNLTVAEMGEDPFEEFQAAIKGRYEERIRSSDDWGYMLGKENSHLQGAIEELLRKLLSGDIKVDAAREELLRRVRPRCPTPPR